MMGVLLAIMLAARATAACADEQSAAPKFIEGSTAKVCQLTGDFDRSRGQPAISRTGERFGVPATDLGNAFEHKGRLYFLFGDTWAPGARWMRDPIAYTTSADSEKIELQFPVDDDGKFRPINVPGIRHLVFEVPGGGISVGDTMYIVFVTDHSPKKIMGRAVLAASEDDGYNFKYLYDLSTEKFLNVAMAEVKPGQIEGLPTPADTVLIWGSGEYRRSNPYLACIPSEKIRDKSAIRYFAGLDESGKPIWKESETDAVSLFEHPTIGEFSVVWCDQLRHWFMLYNSMFPRGIVFRCAKNPWGPWSDAQIIFNPLRDGYGIFMHSPLFKEADGVHLSDVGREKTWGGEYGPYMLKRYFRGDSRRCTIYYAMSTWNPYQVMIMRSDIGYPGKESQGGQ